MNKKQKSTIISVAIMLFIVYLIYYSINLYLRFSINLRLCFLVWIQKRYEHYLLAFTQV